MSKKMMKRTAALSALIAVALSGTVFAAELTIDYANGQYTATGTGIATDITQGTQAGLITELKGVGWVFEDTANSRNFICAVDNYSNNTITVNGGSISSPDRVYGSYAANGNADNNTVKVTAVDGTNFITFGGWGANGADGNTLEVDGVTDGYMTYGGYSSYGHANNNTVTIKNSAVDYVMGGYAQYVGTGDTEENNANNNTINIEDSTVTNSVQGGSAGGYGNAIGNVVNIKNLTYTTNSSTTGGQAIEGGMTEIGNANNNKIIIDGDGTNVNVQVFGGRAQDSGNAQGNEVIINAGTFNNTAKGIVGGVTENQGTESFGQGATNGDATENSVTINGGTINAKVYGGYSTKGDANENIVNITGGAINKNVYSGYGATEASGNTVNVTGGTIDANANVYGGLTSKGDANNNNVDITNTKVGKQIVGGWSNDGTARNNTVKLDKAYGSAAIFTGVSTNADAVGNKLEIILGDNDLDLKGPKALDSYGGNSLNGDAVENVIEISAEGNGKLTGRFYGGASDGADADAIRNKIVINSGTLDVQKMYAGYAVENSGDAIANEMIINGGTITAEDICGGKSYSRNANENIVNITGGTVDAKVYGGYGKAEANDNTVNIGGTADLANASLYGSNHADGTGNLLNVNDGWTGDVKSVQNFNTINISEATWGETAVTVTDTLALNDTTVSVGAVHVAGDDTTFAPNGSSTVIAAGTITGDVSADSSVEVFKGVATIYDASIVKDGNNINIQLAGEETAQFNPQMNPQVLVIGESRTAATAFVNQGTELIEAGLNSLALDEVTVDETKVFAALYNGASKYETGSHVKVNGWSGIVGVGKTTDNGLTYGAFFESGEGNYRTYNDIDGMRMRGDGEANYNGGGLLVRKDNANGVYTEASLRAGNLSNRLDGAVMGSEGLTGYDIDTTYYGAHVGIGKIIPKGEDSLDVYGKFLYTHHDSDTFEINGDEFHFDSLDSQRLRVGFRYNQAQTAKLGLYYGAAYEYEFGGDADNTVVGYDLSTPSLEGSTVIGELGMRYIANVRWSLDVNLRGYTGQRDGWSGSVQANYSF